MKKYRCHKVVEAAKIIGFAPASKNLDPDMAITDREDLRLLFGIDRFAEAVQVCPAWMDKHQPRVGGYFVRYADGYESYSPAKAFEEGYVELTEDSDHETKDKR